MSEDSGYIFNPSQWKKENVANLQEEQIAQLDARYINVGESVFNENIDNLNVSNLNITSTGKIYFAGTNTEQTTAYDPNLIVEEMSKFLSANNIFTGDNTFLKLIIKDPNTIQTSQITENGIDLNIQNNNNSGSIFFKIKDGNGTIKNLTIDQFGNISGLNDVNCSRMRCNDIRLNSSTSRITTDENNNLTITNNISDSGIKLITKTASSVSELLFDSTGTLYVPSLILSAVVKTTMIQLGNQQIYSLLNNIIIDNSAPSATFKLNHYDSIGTKRTLNIDSLMNISGVNNLFLSQLRLPNSTLTNSIEGNLIIDNPVRSSSMIIQNYNETGIMKQLTIDKDINMRGINDLYAKRIYLNDVALDYTKYDEMLVNTKLIKSAASYYTSIEYGLGRFLFLPDARSIESSRNGIIKTGDNVLIGYNVGSLTGNNVLTLCPWASSTNLSGIRATPNNTELYKPKVMDNLKFSDDSIQTTAMTDAYLETKLLEIMNRLNLTTQVPVGTILPYGGSASNPPIGFLGCLGQYVSITTYQNLFNVIGHNFQRGHTSTLPSGYFWLPDLAGAFMKGIGASEIWGELPMLGTTYPGQDPMLYVGEVQKYNVGRHKHQYTDRGVDNKYVGGGSTVQAVKGSNGTYYTGELTFDVNNNQLSEENRPNCIGVNYIIKF